MRERGDRVRDRLGNYVHEGDNILYISGDYRSARKLTFGRVEKVSDKTISVEGDNKRLSSEHFVKLCRDRMEIATENPLPHIKVKYFSADYPELEFINGVSNWIDLRANEDVEYTAGDFKLIRLGVAMKLPEGYEAIVAPRSSTFKNYGIIMTNSLGVIDNAFSGDNDEWRFPMLAMRDGKINKGDRICQFRIQPIMGEVVFNKVEKLDGVDRGGFGTSGVR